MPNRPRFIELDLLRTLAILGMIVYHAAYDLQIFYGWDINVFTGVWKIEQIATASLFLLLVGITSSFSNRHPFKRFLYIGSSALVVTITTYLIDPETYVRFGILHLIALSALLIPLVSKLHMWLMIPGILLLMMKPAIASLTSNTSILLPLGIMYPGFTTVDYFPVVPWFGVILIGYAIGDLLYGNKLRSPDIRGPNLLILAIPGRHSLLLYLVHQPIILGILWIILGKSTV